MRCLFRVRLETEMGQWLPARVGREERGGGTVQRRFVVGCHQKILYCYYFIFMCPRCYLHKDGRCSALAALAGGPHPWQWLVPLWVRVARRASTKSVSLAYFAL